MLLDPVNVIKVLVVVITSPVKRDEFAFSLLYVYFSKHFQHNLALGNEGFYVFVFSLISVTVALTSRTG